MLLRLVLASLLITSLFTPATAQTRKLSPVDKSSDDASFAKFRKDLMGAVKRRDKDFILGVLDPQVRNSFGGDGGIEEFKRTWKLDQPGSQLWDELGTILSMGGSFDTIDNKRTFVAPYVTSDWPDNLDMFDYVAVTDKNVRVRTQPGLKAPVLATLSYDIVKLAPRASDAEQDVQKDGHTWKKIITPNGKTGYVSTKFVRGAADYRAYFEQKNGRWLMTALVAGD